MKNKTAVILALYLTQISIISSGQSTTAFVTNVAVLGHANPFIVSTEASGNVARAEFSFDGTVFAVDYDYPYEGYILPSSMGKVSADLIGNHTVQATLYDSGGQLTTASINWDNTLDCLRSPIEVELLYPGDDFQVYTTGATAESETITVEVYAAVSGWRVVEFPTRPGPDFHRSEFIPEQYAVDYVDLLIDGSIVTTSTNGLPADPLFHEIEYDPVGLVTGSHTMMVRAWSSNECPRTDRITFDVTAPSPNLIYTRDIYRHTNYFEVHINYHNNGSGDADLAIMQERMTGFLGYSSDNAWINTISTDLNKSTREFTMTYIPHPGTTLSPGETFTITNYIVPILYTTDIDYRIGGNTMYRYAAQPANVVTTVNFYSESRVLSYPYGRNRIAEAVEEACASADYILVTNPYKLFRLYQFQATLDMLIEMAELAMHRNGVLGFFSGFNTWNTAFRTGDMICHGSFYGLPGSEIYLGDISEDEILPYYRGNPYELTEMYTVTSRIYSGDAIATGDILTNAVDGLVGLEELIIVHGPNGTTPEGAVTLIQYNPFGNEVHTGSPSISYEEGDRVIAGSFFEPIARNNKQDIMLASHISGTFLFYDGLSGSPFFSCGASYAEEDLLAWGDLRGIGRDLIALADVSEDKIMVYDWNAEFIAFDLYAALSVTLDPDDRIRIGNVWGSSAAELILVDESEDRIYIYAWDTDSHTLDEIFDLSMEFYGGDELLVADFYTSSFDQIGIVRGSNHGDFKAGDINVLACVNGEAVGTRDDLDHLLNQGGGWARQLSPSWVTNGYLLIVGETDVIPAFSHDIYLAWNLSNGDIDTSDRNYASTAGSSHWPELGIGRIPGRTAGEIQGILASANEIARGDVRFANRNSMSMSGERKGPSGEGDSINFYEEMVSIQNKLLDYGFNSFSDYDPNDGQFMTNCQNKDVIFLAAHGSEVNWEDITTWEIEADLDLGILHPFVYASSCLTGCYDDDDNFARMFLKKGASSYVGATEVSIFPWSKRLGQAFFSQFGPDVPSGYAMKKAIQYRVSGKANYLAWDLNYNKYNCAIYQLLGDPKQAYIDESTRSARSLNTTTQPQLMITTTQGPLSALHVDIPDFEVASTDGVDAVSIPGQSELYYYGYPSVPVYVTSVHFPAGYNVQQVQLSLRNSSSVSNGLVLGTATPYLNNSEATEPPLLAGILPTDWWPIVTSDWEVVQLPDHSTLLNITMYPFYYNTQTTDSVYYQSYDFLISYTSNSVTFNKVVLEKQNYDPGETVKADCYILNSNQIPINASLFARILTNGSDVAETLNVRSLDNMQAMSSCLVEWDSAGFPANDYLLELVVQDASQQVLARETIDFTLGTTECTVDSFTVDPADFAYGDDVQIDVSVNNTGTKLLNGTLVVLVLDANGNHQHEFRYGISNLMAGYTFNQQVDWNNADLVSRDCSIIAYVLYSGKTTSQDGSRSWEDAPLLWDAILFDASEGTTIKWPSVNGRTYTLKQCTNLLAQTFSTISNGITATPPQNVFTNSVPGAQAFYQLIEHFTEE